MATDMEELRKTTFAVVAKIYAEGALECIDAVLTSSVVWELTGARGLL